VRSDGVVLDSPALNEHLRVQQRVEDFPVEQFVSQLSVERLDIAVLSGTARLDEQRLHVDSFQPILHPLRCELWTVVRANVIRDAPPDEQVRQPLENVLAAQLPGHINRQALSGKLVIRCVFVKTGIDTANKNQWQSHLHMHAMMDEFQVRVNSDHIRTVLEGMFLDGLVRGTLPLGYKGEPIPGKLTKRARPRSRIVVDGEGAKLVVQIFEWFIEARLSLAGIAQKLNSMPNVPNPRNSKGWTRNSGRAVLTREAYRGV
jgi:Recombinase